MSFIGLVYISKIEYLWLENSAAAYKCSIRDNWMKLTAHQLYQITQSSNTKVKHMGGIKICFWRGIKSTALKKKIFSVCPIWLPKFFFLLSFLNPNWVPKIESGMDLTPFPSSILDEIRTHKFKIMSRVR